MENKIDQFFKNKLENHVSTPPEEAWAKVEVNLSKKNNIAVWRIAAAILIMGALVSVIIWSQRGAENNEQLLATKKLPKDNPSKEKSVEQISPIEKKEEAKSLQKKSPITLPQSENNSLPRSVSSLPRSVSSLPRSVSSQTSLPRSVSSQTENNSDQKKQDEAEMWSVRTLTSVAETTVAASANKQEEEKINTKATPPATIASTKRKSIKLEFTLDDYSTEQPVATVSEEKNSGIKKVWELALDVKNGDGRVREIKNELFAHSFKKNRNQLGVEKKN